MVFYGLNPTIFEFGPIAIHWYGLMYVLGFFSAYMLISVQVKARELGLQGKVLQDLFFYLILGLIIGARIGYIAFYQFSELGTYLRHPIEIVAVWHGGMSFHGGLIGIIAAGVLYCRYHSLPFWAVADRVIVTAPIGLGLGRLGNFINGELFGRPSSMPWAMVFPNGGPIPRHPSQLYEAILEGAVLFSVLWAMRNRDLRPGTLFCIFLGGYGALRFVAEFYRQPDPQIGLLWETLTMGQVFCLLMIFSAILIWFVRKNNE